MSELQKELFFYILDKIIDAYYQQTAYQERFSHKEHLCRQFIAQLTPQQQELFEEVEMAYHQLRDCELEAMFLAAYDQALTLTRPTLTA